MKKIKLKDENRGQGLGMALDELWNTWKLLDNGTYYETDTNFTLTNTNGDSFVASKTEELFAAKMYNRFIETDLKVFNVYEGQNPTGGYFILYKFKNADRQNEFVISSIGGIAGGSSIVFEVL
ncbi:MAG: hypothetical protein KA278_08235 [Flavobacterium sp.]|nr:hypothetical protein [Flavobacterium sp.]